MRVNDAITLPAPIPPAVARLRWVALAAAALLTAIGEFMLASLVGYPLYVAWLFPIALDIYAYCAFAAKARRDVAAALVLMIVCQALAHLVAVSVIPAHWSLVILVSAVPPIICWRIHHLAAHRTPIEVDADTAQLDNAVTADIVPDPVDEVPAKPQRPAAEIRQLAAAMKAVDPKITRRAIASKLNISERRLRYVLNAAA
jgi:hypothetical protein